MMHRFLLFNDHFFSLIIYFDGRPHQICSELTKNQSTLVELGQLVSEYNASLDSVFCDDAEADYSSRGTVAAHCQRQAARGEVYRLLLAHVLLVVRVHIAVDVGGAGATDGYALTNAHSSDGDGVHLT